MSEVTHFFAARVPTTAAFRQALERARVQAILEPPEDVSSRPPAARSAEQEGRWLALASQSENREVLRKLTDRLIEIFDDGGGWSLSLFLRHEQRTLHQEELEPARAGAGVNAQLRTWLGRFLARSPETLLETLATGGPLPWCEALGIPFLELIDQDMVDWEELARQFPGRYVLDSEEVSE